MDALQKELQKEIKVKEGLERFFNSDLDPRVYNAKYLEQYKQMYEDTKAKITYLKMQIERLQLIKSNGNGGELFYENRIEVMHVFRFS